MLVDFSYKKFLIIDDFSDFRTSLKRMIQSFDAADIDEAANGDAAVNLIAKKAYDIILCDYNLGYDRKDGQQVLEEIKHRNLIRISSIFMMITAESSLPMVIGAMEYQPDDYLVKPFTKEVLKNRLEKLIAKKIDFTVIEKAIQNKEYSRAIAICDEKINSNPRNLFEYLRLKSNLFLTIGDYQNAKAVFDKVLEMRDIPWAKLGLGKISFFTEDYVQAANIFRSLIEETRTFIEAYDWLAKTLLEQKAAKEAQNVLMIATEISPKSTLRQKTLGEISYKNKDLDTAEKSFKTAIKTGKNSCFKSPSTYTGLAKTFMDKNAHEQALDVVKDAGNEFRENPDASFHASAMKGIIYSKMNRHDEARKAVEEAARFMDTVPIAVDEDMAMDFAKTCFELGETEKGTKIMQDVVRNHHENEDVLRKVQDVFKDMRMQDAGSKLITSTRKEIIQINNKGVQLVEEGKLEEAIDYFEKAAKGLQGNKIIVANAAQSLIMHMQKNGKTEEYLRRAGQYLDRIRKTDPSFKKYHKLLNMFEQLVAS